MKTVGVWHRIATDTLRLKVYGGWLVKVNPYGTSVAMSFVSDPEHLWVVEIKE